MNIRLFQSLFGVINLISILLIMLAGYKYEITGVGIAPEVCVILITGLMIWWTIGSAMLYRLTEEGK